MQTTTPLPQAPKQTGRYLYAVIHGAEDRDFGPFGIDGAMVYALSDGQVAAVVSNIHNGKIRPERRRLAAHHDVLKRLTVQGTVLPMSFGIIADGPEAVQRILAANRAAFLEQLRLLDGKLEMGLRVLWDVPNIFEYFVAASAELRALRDHIVRGGREPSHDDQIELGRLFDQTLTRARQDQTEKVTDVLRRCCFEIKENKPRNEREVMNLACLIGRGTEKEFEQGVFEAAKQFDNHYAFDFNGPWPPHNFVELDLQT